MYADLHVHYAVPTSKPLCRQKCYYIYRPDIATNYTNILIFSYNSPKKISKAHSRRKKKKNRRNKCYRVIGKKAVRHDHYYIMACLKQNNVANPPFPLPSSFPLNSEEHMSSVNYSGSHNFDSRNRS